MALQTFKNSALAYLFESQKIVNIDISIDVLFEDLEGTIVNVNLLPCKERFLLLSNSVNFYHPNGDFFTTVDFDFYYNDAELFVSGNPYVLDKIDRSLFRDADLTYSYPPNI